jgi:hypothetical protein
MFAFGQVSRVGVDTLSSFPAIPFGAFSPEQGTVRATSGVVESARSDRSTGPAAPGRRFEQVTISA